MGVERAKISMHALSLSRMLEKLYGGSKAIPPHAKRVVSLPKTIKKINQLQDLTTSF